MILNVEVTVGGAEIGGHALALVKLSAVVAVAFTVDVGLIGGADGVAESIGGLESRLAEALIGVAVIVVSGRAVGADTLDADVLRLADAVLSGLTEELIDALAGGDGAGLSVGVVGLSGETPGAGSLDDVIALGAITLATVEVVDLVGTALDAADTLVDIIDLSYGALCAEVVDEEVSRLADAATGDPIFVDVADRSADSVAALA